MKYLRYLSLRIISYWRSLTLVAMIFLLFSCTTSPAEKTTQTPILQIESTKSYTTSTSLPTRTPIPTDNITPTTTFTPTSPRRTINPIPTFDTNFIHSPTPTIDPNITPGPTPDLRVIDADPYTFLLKIEDLPKDAEYFIEDSSYLGHHPNPDLADDPDLPFQENMTGWRDGWFVYYTQGNQDSHAPYNIFDTVDLFGSVDAAQRYVQDHKWPRDLYYPLETDLKIGDNTRVFSNITDDLFYRGYSLEFSYRNVVHSLMIGGLEEDVSLDYLAELARMLLAQLEAAPLSDHVTFMP